MDDQEVIRSPGSEPADRIVLTLRQQGTLSRAEIARSTGLAKSTVSEKVAELSKPRGPYRNGLKRRRDIVEAATVVFGQYGYHGGSLRTIAEMVGTTPATLVSYFTSKELLLVAVLENWSAARSQTEGERGLSSFRAYISLMRFHIEHPGLIQLFLTMSTEATQPDHPARPFILARQQRTRRTMVSELQRAIDLGEIRSMTAELLEREARLMAGVLDGVELGWLTDSTVDLEGVVRHYVDEAIARWTQRPIDEVREETDAYLAARSRVSSPGRRP